VRIVDDRIVDGFVPPVPVLAVPEAEVTVPCRGHQEAVDVEAESTEHGSYVEIRDFEKGFGRPVSDRSLVVSHQVILVVRRLERSRKLLGAEIRAFS
jgi:hypothetical protein